MSDSELHRSNGVISTVKPPKQPTSRFNTNYHKKSHPNANLNNNTTYQNHHYHNNNYNRRRNQQQKPTKFYHANSAPLIGGSVELGGAGAGCSSKTAQSPSKNHPTPVQPARFFYNSNNFRTTTTTTTAKKE